MQVTQTFCTALRVLLGASQTSVLSNTAPVAVAVSGGSDSMALLLLAQRTGVTLHAFTVDHQLRKESAEEAAWVAAQCAKRAIAHSILTPVHNEAGNNLMQAARQWRYDALAEACHARGIAHCLLGHHADDQLETIALAHTRGHGTYDLSQERCEGEAGMRASRHYRDIQFLRPLLTLQKQTLQDFLRNENQPWLEDPTNTNTLFARARVRQQLAKDTALRAALTATLAQRIAARDAREAALAEALPQCVQHKKSGVQLSLTRWHTLTTELQTLLLANLLREVGGNLHRPRRAETQRLADALRQHTHGKRTLAHCVITWKAGLASIDRELHPLKPQRTSPYNATDLPTKTAC